MLDITGTTFQFIYDGTTWEVTATAGKQGATGLTGATGPITTGTASGVCFFNNSGNLSTDNALTWNSTSDILTVSGTITTNNLDVNARYTEGYDNVSIVSNALTLDLSTGNLFNCTLNANINTMTVTNVPSGVGVGLTLILTADGTLRTVNWPTTTKWPGGTAPTMTSTNGKVDIFSLLTVNSGVTWYGFTGGQNF